MPEGIILTPGTEPIGAAAGALGGLAGVLGSRGADVVLPAGTTMEMVLDRELRYSIMELPGRAQ